MIQDIHPHTFNNSYQPVPPQAHDFLLCFSQNKALFDTTGGERMFPTAGDLLTDTAYTDCIYLFGIDDRAMFLYIGQPPAATGRFLWGEVEQFRTIQPEWLAFCGITASHLYRWYHDHAFCGRCATTMQHKADERALICPACAKIEFPTLSPAVIVAVTDGDRLLLTRYANRGYRRWALVAGFAEIGETLEETVAREVMEEVGLRVKNLRYYKSQPWGYSQSLLVGFFAELDGDDTITLDEYELAEAMWTRRGDIEPISSTVSLTAEMMEAFRTAKMPLSDTMYPAKEL